MSVASLPPKFDVIIFGIGPAACATAILLSKHYSVLMLSKPLLSNQQVGENLAASVREILPLFKIESQMLDLEHCPAYQSVSLWGTKNPIWKDSLYNPDGHGWHIDREKFNALILDKALKSGAIHRSCTQADFSWKGSWHVSFYSNSNLETTECSILVDGTGRQRFVAKKLGSKIVKSDSLIAANTIVANDKGPSETIIEASENGWWYTACIPNNRRVITYFTNSKSENLKQHTDSRSFVTAIQNTQILKEALPELQINNLSGLHFRYANSEKSANICGENWICVGDSAAAFDPISSQGISTAFKMSVKVADAIHQKIHQRDNLAFARYESTYNDLFSEYIGQRQRCYSMVKNWPNSAFWKNNAGA